MTTCVQTKAVAVLAAGSVRELRKIEEGRLIDRYTPGRLRRRVQRASPRESTRLIVIYIEGIENDLCCILTLFWGVNYFRIVKCLAS